MTWIHRIKKIIPEWRTVEKLLRVVEVSAIIGGVVFAAMQIRDVRNMQSAQLMLEFDRDLNTSPDAQIITAIEDGQPLLKSNKGNFTTTDIDKYLSIFELLNNTHEAGLITDDMLYNAFSYDIEKTYKNKEIEDYVAGLRKEDSLIFNGFDTLAKSIMLTN